jgi:hypothetical protein
VRTDAQTDAALLGNLDSFCYGLATRDADGVVQLFAPGPDVVMATTEESLARPGTSHRAAGAVAA